MTRILSKDHFHPYSLFTEDTDKNAPVFCNGEKAYIVDSRTGDKYLNEDLCVIRFKCALLTIGTPIVHTIAAVTHMLYNAVKLLSFYHFWKTLDDVKENQSDYGLNQRVSDAKSDAFHILFAPINILLLECAALYGMLLPHNGRKLYASLETFAYGSFVLAPCFQPKPDTHLLGGDMDMQNAW